MKSATGKLIAAICVTSMDIEVAVRYGPFLWHSWNAIAWARIMLMLLAGGIAFTLMDIWSKTLSPQANLRVHSEISKGIPSSRKAMEAADV